MDFVFVNQLGIQLWSIVAGFIWVNGISSFPAVALIRLASNSITWSPQADLGNASVGVPADFTARLDVNCWDCFWWNKDLEYGNGGVLFGRRFWSISAIIEPSAVLIFVFVDGAQRRRPLDGNAFACGVVFDGVGNEKSEK